MKVNSMFGNKRLFTCECGWFRELVTDPEMQSQIIHHLVYGRVSLAHAALLDIKHHECTNHEISQRIVQGVIRHAA